MTSDALEVGLTSLKRMTAAGQWPAAAELSAALCESAPTDARVWSAAAELSLRTRKFPDALEHLRQALVCTPFDAMLLIRYGLCLLHVGRPDEALKMALKAAATDAMDAGALDSLGTLLTLLEQPASALPYFQRAVQTDPKSLDFRYNLAMAERMTGDFTAAELNLDRVIASRPHDGEAHHARSGLRRQSPDRNHVAQLELVLPQLRGRRSALPVAFALAKELEDLGNHARSFSYLQAACHTLRASLQYDVSDDVSVLEALQRRHTADTLAALATRFDSAEPIFIVGLPRSGTTLVEQIMAGHSAVTAAGETDAFQRILIDGVGRISTGPVKKLDFVDRSLQVDFGTLGPRYIQAVRNRAGGTPYFTDKLPLNYLYAGLIHAALPRARFIALHRHPMDSCYAMYKTLFASGYPFTYDLMDLGRYYVAWERLMRHWHEVIGEQWLAVNYETLVASPELVSRKIISHCGLDWQPASLEFHLHAAAVTTASAVQVREPVHTRSVGVWRAHARELAPLSGYLADHGISVD